MRESWWSGQWTEEVVYLLRSCPSYLKAKAFENRACDLLVSRGWKVVRQYRVKDRGDGKSGKVDIVAYKRRLKAAIELDRIHPRKKSIFKVRQVPGATFRLVFCREHFKW